MIAAIHFIFVLVIAELERRPIRRNNFSKRRIIYTSSAAHP
jgi:hypothetical protein